MFQKLRTLAPEIMAFSIEHLENGQFPENITGWRNSDTLIVKEKRG
jgi:hypothetical protein